MKRLLIGLLGVTLFHSAEAQVFTSESLGGAALGGIAGAIIGNQHHGQSGEGAAIGAGIGYVLGTVAHRNRQYQAAAYSPGYASAPYRAEYYPYYRYGSAYRPSYYGGSLYSHYYPRRRPNYAIGGAALGGIAGAVIGNQHHGQSGEGAAIGAAAGLLLGGLAERNARLRERETYERSMQSRMYYNHAAQSASSHHSAAAAPSPTVSQNQPQPQAKHASPMKGANRLFGR